MTVFKASLVKSGCSECLLSRSSQWPVIVQERVSRDRSMVIPLATPLGHSGPECLPQTPVHLNCGGVVNRQGDLRWRGIRGLHGQCSNGLSTCHRATSQPVLILRSHIKASTCSAPGSDYPGSAALSDANLISVCSAEP